MSQRKLKKALMLFRGIEIKEFKTLFKVMGKDIKGLWSTMYKYRILLTSGKTRKGKND